MSESDFPNSLMGLSGLSLAAGVLGGGAQTYSQKVAAIAPANNILWHKMAEASGATALDSSGQGNNGAYTGVTLAQTGIGDGLTSARFTTDVSLNNIYSAALATDFNAAEGSFACWMKVSGVGVWTDTLAGYICNIGADGNNHVRIFKSATDNTLTFQYKAAGTVEEVSVAGQSSTGWLHVGITWSKSGDAVKAYLNGAQTGATQTGLDTWAGALADGAAFVGALTVTPVLVFSGFLAHALLYSTPLTAAQMLALATNP